MRTRLVIFLVLVSTSTGISFSQETKAIIMKEGAVVRLHPQADSIVIAHLPIGSVLTVEKSFGEWIKVILPPNEEGFRTTGYIHSSDVLLDVAPKVQPAKHASLSFYLRFSFSIGGGLSLPIGEDSEFWNMGFFLSFGAYGYLNRNIMLGGQASLHRWAPNESEFTEYFDSLGYEGVSWDITGGASVIGIVPSVKVIGKWTEDRTVNIFGQAGFGLFFVDLDTTLTTTYQGRLTRGSVRDSWTEPGFSISGGIVIGKMGNTRIEIAPAYTMIFTDDTTHMISLGVYLGR